MEGSAAGVGEGEANTGGLGGGREGERSVGGGGVCCRSGRGRSQYRWVRRREGGREVCWGWRGLLQEWEREKPIQVG